MVETPQRRWVQESVEEGPVSLRGAELSGGGMASENCSMSGKGQ